MQLYESAVYCPWENFALPTWFNQNGYKDALTINTRQLKPILELYWSRSLKENLFRSSVKPLLCLFIFYIILPTLANWRTFLSNTGCSINVFSDDAACMPLPFRVLKKLLYKHGLNSYKSKTVVEREEWSIYLYYALAKALKEVSK